MGVYGWREEHSVAQAVPGRPAAADGADGRDPAAQEAGAAGLLQRPAVLERLRDRGDPARAEPRRPGAAPPRPVGRRWRWSCCWRSWCCPTGRPATPTPTAAAPTRSAAPTSGRTPRWPRPAPCWSTTCSPWRCRSPPGSPTSSRPSRRSAPHAVPICLALIVVLALMNLRGVKESGTRLRDPHLRVRRRRLRHDRLGRAPGRCSGTPVGRVGAVRIHATHGTTGLLALAAGPARVRPGLHRADRRRGGQQRRAELQAAQEPATPPTTLAIMGALTITMFAGITAAGAASSHVRIAESADPLIGAPAGTSRRP